MITSKLHVGLLHRGVWHGVVVVGVVVVVVVGVVVVVVVVVVVTAFFWSSIGSPLNVIKIEMRILIIFFI